MAEGGFSAREGAADGLTTGAWARGAWGREVGEQAARAGGAGAGSPWGASKAVDSAAAS